MSNRDRVPKFSYDERCLVLAKHFIHHVSDLNEEVYGPILAQCIQDAIEGWFENEAATRNSVNRQ